MKKQKINKLWWWLLYLLITELIFLPFTRASGLVIAIVLLGTIAWSLFLYFVLNKQLTVLGEKSRFFTFYPTDNHSKIIVDGTPEKGRVSKVLVTPKNGGVYLEAEDYCFSTEEIKQMKIAPNGQKRKTLRMIEKSKKYPWGDSYSLIQDLSWNLAKVYFMGFFEKNVLSAKMTTEIAETKKGQKNGEGNVELKEVDYKGEFPLEFDHAIEFTGETATSRWDVYIVATGRFLVKKPKTAMTVTSPPGNFVNKIGTHMDGALKVYCTGRTWQEIQEEKTEKPDSPFQKALRGINDGYEIEVDGNLTKYDPLIETTGCLFSSGDMADFNLKDEENKKATQKFELNKINNKAEEENQKGLLTIQQLKTKVAEELAKTQYQEGIAEIQLEQQYAEMLIKYAKQNPSIIQIFQWRNLPSGLISLNIGASGGSGFMVTQPLEKIALGDGGGNIPPTKKKRRPV